MNIFVLGATFSSSRLRTLLLIASPVSGETPTTCVVVIAVFNVYVAAISHSIHPHPHPHPHHYSHLEPLRQVGKMQKLRSCGAKPCLHSLSDSTGWKSWWLKDEGKSENHEDRDHEMMRKIRQEWNGWNFFHLDRQLFAELFDQLPLQRPNFLQYIRCRQILGLCW